MPNFNPAGTAQEALSENELLTVSEIAAHLRVPKSWIYARTRETGPDAMPRLKVGHYLRFEKSRVRDWLESCSRS